ncbi:interleukin-10 receptor subunit beta-like isoform X1 [Carcharodon carcharias]|uniref:interleukin-10 receptor subunit beta-like isoform X1 n=1 Tax=Carcharodon carcharias TaxID=13397 RepID=UPI001B7F3038|nr:interleukin-10 receptor subunit beta-like isoform X1 [Carcharodon carcharias]
MAPSWAFLTAVLTLQAFGEIQMPTNMQIHAFNLKYLLKWDDVQRSNYSVNYTVQYKRLRRAEQVNYTMNVNIYVRNWTDVKGCESISHTECDFTSTDILFFGQYILRLQAQRGNQTSAWLTSSPFIPYKHNKIGPPSIKVDSKGSFLNVYILGPETENHQSIQEVYKDIKYRITYWKKHSHELKNMKNSTGKSISLKLEPWISYCLHVQVVSVIYGIEGQLSRVVCEKIKGTIQLWQIGVTFIVSQVVIFGVVLGCFFFVYGTYRCIKYAFFPPHILPEHLQEYFSEPSQSAFLKLPSEGDVEECCDELKVILETKSLTSYSSSLTLPNTGNEKNDQSGQTSIDSGQFSNGGSSKSDGTEELEGRTLTELDLHNVLL